jgi:hypothetical protein
VARSWAKGDFLSIEELDGLGDALVLGAHVLDRLHQQVAGLAAAFLDAELALDDVAEHGHLGGIGGDLAIGQGGFLAFEAFFQIGEALVLVAALLVELVDLGLGDGEVSEGVDDVVLGGVVVDVEALDLFVRLAEVFGESDVLLDEVLDAAVLVELEQGAHLFALVQEGFVLGAQLGVSVAAFLEFVFEVVDAEVRLVEFLGFFREFLFQGLELGALACDDGAGDLSLDLEVAFEVGAFLLHHLEISFERGVAGECLGVGAAALGECHGHGFAFLFQTGDALVEGIHFVFHRIGGEPGAERLDLVLRRFELGLEQISLAGDVADA